MQHLHILYISSMYDLATQKRAEKLLVRHGYAVQRYHYLSVLGLIANNSQDCEISVDAISSIPVFRCNAILERQATFRSEKLSVRYLFSSKIPLIRHLFAFIGAFVFVLTSKSSSVVVMDILKVSIGLGALLAAKVRGLPLIGIVTDLPKDLGFYNSSKLKFFSTFLLERQDAYVLLADNMKHAIRLKSKPFIVSEGHAEKHQMEKPKTTAEINPPVVVYAGTLDPRYGIEELLNAFDKLHDLEVHLYVYGSGDMESEVRSRALKNARIVYYGAVPNEEVLTAERQATVLINPRPSHLEFTRYSFPSKTLEYMASGRPVIMTNLPAMPDEYHPHVWITDDETSTGFANKIREVLSLSDEEIDNKGIQAQAFVYREKNNVKQAARLISLIQTICGQNKNGDDGNENNKI